MVLFRGPEVPGGGFVRRLNRRSMEGTVGAVVCCCVEEVVEVL